MKGFIQGLKHNVAIHITLGILSLAALFSILNFSTQLNSPELTAARRVPPYTPVVTGTARVSITPRNNPIQPGPVSVSAGSLMVQPPPGSGASVTGGGDAEPNDYLLSAPSISFAQNYEGSFNDFFDIYRISNPSSGYTMQADLMLTQSTVVPSNVFFGVYDATLPYPQSYIAYTESGVNGLFRLIVDLNRVGDYYIVVYSGSAPPIYGGYRLVTYRHMQTGVPPYPTNTVTPYPSGYPNMSITPTYVQISLPPMTPTSTPTPTYVQISLPPITPTRTRTPTPRTISLAPTRTRTPTPRVSVYPSGPIN